MASGAIGNADPSPFRFRAILRLLALAGWFLFCVVPHLLARKFGRSNWPRRFLRGVAWICGADVRVEGRAAGSGTLLIANHLSWLDIPVLAGSTGCAFVSKAEVRGQPFMRWIADQNATVYVDRSDKRSIHCQADGVRSAVRRPQPLAIFPEGTVNDAQRLLPFKPSLLSAVAPPPPGVTLRPVAIQYERARELAWIPGEPGVANFLRVLGLPSRRAVTVRLLDPLDPEADRKRLAKAAHDRIAAALAPSGIAPAGL